MSPFRLLIPITVLAALACASASGPALNFAGVSPVSPAPGQRIGVGQAIVLLDASSSSSGDFLDSKSAAGSFVGAMPNGEYDAGSIVFGGPQRAGQALSPFTRVPLKNSVANATHFGGYTPIPEVLREAGASVAGKTGDLAVVLFSDGVPSGTMSEGEAGREQAKRRTLAAGRELIESRPDDRVCIHSVQTGNSEVGGRVLQQLSALSDCGTSRGAASLQSASAMSGFAKEVTLLGAARPAPKPKPAPQATAPRDGDGDGVVDARDDCPNSPRGAPVNSRGCWVLQDMNFAFDSAVIESQYHSRLERGIGIMRENLSLRISINGYTDSRGAEAYNQALSERRAKAVYDYVVAAGINPARLEYRGLGESNPIASNDTEEGRAENRRIQFKILD